MCVKRKTHLEHNTYLAQAASEAGWVWQRARVPVIMVQGGGGDGDEVPNPGPAVERPVAG